MKVKIFEILNAAPALGKLSDEPLSVKTSYGLAKLNKAVQSELDIYEKERIKLCERYGKKNETEQRYEFEPEHQREFEAAIAELQAQETDISADRIDLSGENIKITARDILAIEKFIEEV